MKIFATLSLISRGRSLGAFSLVEMLLVLACISSCAAMAFFAATNTSGAIKESKLVQDVSTLNRAVRTYQVSGGKIPSDADGFAVIQKLKTVSNKSRQKSIAGLRQSMIDLRLRGITTTREGFPRAVWDKSRKTFLVQNTGSGFREFVLDAEAPQELAEEAREVSLPMDDKDRWIWAYADQNSRSQGLRVGAGTTAMVAEGPSADPALRTLKAPGFSLPAGIYDYTEYKPGLPVSLVDKNEPNTSEIYYAIGNAPWQLWTGSPISVPRSLQVELKAYSGPLDPDSYEDSAVASANYSTIVFQGTSTGLFNKAFGESGSESDQIWGETSNSFSWGGNQTQTGSTFSPANELRYNGASFNDIVPEQLFVLGSLTYFNAHSTKGTEISGVQIEITLTLSGLNVVEKLPYRINLISTGSNIVDDYVAIPAFSKKLTTTFHGREFWFVITFRPESSDLGFVTESEVHPKSGKSLTVPVFGRFTATPH